MPTKHTDPVTGFSDRDRDEPRHSNLADFMMAAHNLHLQNQHRAEIRASIEQEQTIDEQRAMWLMLMSDETQSNIADELYYLVTRFLQTTNAEIKIERGRAHITIPPSSHDHLLNVCRRFVTELPAKVNRYEGELHVA